jgi:DNA polymerase
VKTLAIDIETYSDQEIRKTGMHRYAQSDAFEIILFAYSIDGKEPVCIDLSRGEELPVVVEMALTDPEVLKTAWNAPFERTCIARHFGIELPEDQWECTMARAAHLGYPLALDQAAKAVGVEQKHDGKALIRYFCQPCKPTKTNGGRTRNLPEHAPEKWDAFVDYCNQDVVVEQAIRKQVLFYPVPAWERQLWCLDQRINQRGIRIDRRLVVNAIHIDREYREALITEAIQLTGLGNPNSGPQLKAWLQAAMPMDSIETLKKTEIPTLIKQAEGYVSKENIQRVLGIRQELSKTSIKKYIAMMHGVGSDGRIRGLLQYYGANRTGRWAGRLVQVQNLPKNSEETFGKKMANLDIARDLVIEKDADLLQAIWGNVPDILSQLLRTAFVAKKGHRLIIADFSAIEARIIAWLAGEQWRLDVFNTHGKIYEASAAQMFRVPIEEVTKGSPLRQKGKVAELALGYQGGPGAIISMEISAGTAPEKRIPEKDLKPLVKAWRDANPKIVKLWYDMERAAIRCVSTGESVRAAKGVRFLMGPGVLFAELPSGRRLSYLKPELRDGKYSKQLYYLGLDQDTKKWGRLQTYGGKIVENLVQAIARDCLAYSMLNLDAAGYNIVMHVHDETISEMPEGKGSLEEVDRIMGQSIPWAPGLPLTAESYETKYYKKD